MKERDQEGYRTLGWIINKSEQGLFLVIADEKMQAEIAAIYRRGAVEIYDYRRHPAEYAFRDIQEWVTGLPETEVFMVVNFHLAHWPSPFFVWGFHLPRRPLLHHCPQQQIIALPAGYPQT